MRMAAVGTDAVFAAERRPDLADERNEKVVGLILREIRVGREDDRGAPGWPTVRAKASALAALLRPLAAPKFFCRR